MNFLSNYFSTSDIILTVLLFNLRLTSLQLSMELIEYVLKGNHECEKRSYNALNLLSFKISKQSVRFLFTISAYLTHSNFYN
jgi:Zn/Cd-binding protein ZinT